MDRVWIASALLAMAGLLSACADPLADVERLDEVELADGGEAAAALPAPEERAEAPGLFARILGGNLPQPVPTVEGAPTAADNGTAEADADTLDPVAETVATEAPSRGGFLGLFGNRNQGGGASATPAAVGPDAAPATPGVRLPYGTIATACGVANRDLGTRIATASGYEVHDTRPGTITPRTHYLTGFDDRCPRQFTAALVTFGDVGTHEVVRYLPSNAATPYSESDEAYEAIKARFCGASRGQPCGGRIDRLARRTTFVTVYERFGTNPVWADILLHDGQVLAMDFEGR